MKKHFTTFLMPVASLFMALTLAGCGDDIVLPNDNSGNEGNTEKGGVTVFTSGSEEETRTSLYNNHFYWEPGDRIWIDNNGTYQSSISSDIAGRAGLAKFTFAGTLTDNEYPVFYTGDETVSTSATSVTIPSTQTQPILGNSSHLGKNGDCGVATATKDANGSYGFKLKHMASYLLIRPRINTTLTGNKLLKVEIMSGGTNIAGTYAFSSAGLAASPTSGGSSTVTLNCGTSGFAITGTAQNLYAVIHPGTHRLTLRYTLQTSRGATFTVTQSFPSKSYSPNGVTTFNQQIDLLVYDLTYYPWGSNMSFVVNSSYSTFDHPYQYQTGVWAYAPNANALLWYIQYGDPRYDATTHWTDDNGASVYTGGVWIKKSTAISSNWWTYCVYQIPGTSGNDARQVPSVYEHSTTYYQTAGRPANITNYFFLPACGYYDYITNPSVPVYPYVNKGTAGWYWSCSTYPDVNGQKEAYALRFTPWAISSYPFGRYDGFVVGQGLFQ